MGPDFLIEEAGQRVWVEVICPAPVGISEQWLNPRHGQVVSKPANEVLLRWTHAVKTKADRLVGTPGRRGYLEEGVVHPDDAYVIAINGCRFRHGPFPELDGISQFPYAVEAVFPVGPMEIRLNRETLQTVSHGHQQRWAINKPNPSGGIDVPTYAFLDPRYRPVSAIWALDANGHAAMGGIEPSALIHNPNATNPLPLGWVGVDQEFHAVRGDHEDWILQRV
jgi:type I restriction enzyme S subunit